VSVIATCMVRHENQDSVMKQMRRLHEVMFPQDPKERQAHEDALKDVLQREGQKSYKVRRLNLGERGE
jgi:hypothetical protein